MKINPMKPNFRTNLLVARASMYFNTLGAPHFANVRLNAPHQSIAVLTTLGKLCSRKCHGPQKDGKDVCSDNCPLEI